MCRYVQMITQEMIQKLYAHLHIRTFAHQKCIKNFVNSYKIKNQFF